MFRLGLFSLIACGASVPAASAQNCCGGAGGGCGPRSSNSAGGGNCGGILGRKAFPFSDEQYIRQFCGPHVAAGSCFGYFKPQITPWGQACPLYGDARVDAAASGTYKYPLIAGAPREPRQLPTPVSPPKADLPKVMPKSLDSTTPPKAPPGTIVPAKPPSAPATIPKFEQGVTPPAVPEVTVPQIPAQAKY
jgi:hypothetical protein